jgi:hypothetical protein
MSAGNKLGWHGSEHRHRGCLVADRRTNGFGIASIAAAHAAPLLGKGFRLTGAARGVADHSDHVRRDLGVDGRVGNLRQSLIESGIIDAIAAGIDVLHIGNDLLGTRGRQQHRVPDAQRSRISHQKPVTVVTEIDHGCRRSLLRQLGDYRCDVIPKLGEQHWRALPPGDGTPRIGRIEQRQSRCLASAHERQLTSSA